jgi:hypothetical protein
MTFNDYKSK